MKRKMIFMLSGCIFLLGTSFLLADESGIKIEGFVDSSFFADLKGGTENLSLDQVELNIIKEAEKVSLRADIEFFEGSGAELEQGYITFICPLGSGLTYQFGKFNAPIGFELLDPPDMYQYSHSLVFNNGLPTNLSGFMISSVLNEMVDVSLYAVNGWDVNVDNNTATTIGGRVGISPVEDFNFGISAIRGPEKDDNNSDIRTVFDLDATFTAVEYLTLGAELNIGTEDKASAVKAGEDAEWFGFLVMANYGLNDWSGITFRYGYFDDKDGSRTGAAGKRTAITISPTFILGDGLGALIEYRTDTIDSVSTSGLAVEFTYSF